MAFDDRKKLYIGDSRGGIHIYNIDVLFFIYLEQCQHL